MFVIHVQAINKGTNYAGVTEGFIDIAPDVGWNEFAIITASNTNNNKVYNYIQSAINVSTANQTVVVFPGTHASTIFITNANDIKIIALAWITNSNNTSTQLTNGITIIGKSNILVQGFTISNVGGVGVYISNSCSNITIANNAILNVQDGIFTISNVMRSTFSQNLIKNNSRYGVFLSGESKLNDVISNDIITNAIYGVYITGDLADSNCILSNRIFSVGAASSAGIWIEAGDNTIIARNLISRHDFFGILCKTTALDTQIYNNTITRTLTYDGVKIEDSSTGALTNNIITSNQLYGFEDPAGGGTTYQDYNVYFGNGTAPFFGGMVSGINLSYLDPMIEYIGYAISNSLSSAVDSGFTIPIFAASSNGAGIDIGWLESPYTNLFNIFNVVITNPAPNTWIKNTGLVFIGITNKNTGVIRFGTNLLTLNIVVPPPKLGPDYFYSTSGQVDISSISASWSGSTIDNAYTGDATYSPVIRATGGAAWGNARAFTLYTSGTLTNYTNLQFKIKTASPTFTIQVPPPATDKVFTITTVGTALSGGWYQVNLPLTNFPNATNTSTEFGIWTPFNVEMLLTDVGLLAGRITSSGNSWSTNVRFKGYPITNVFYAIVTNAVGHAVTNIQTNYIAYPASRRYFWDF